MNENTSNQMSTEEITTLSSRELLNKLDFYRQKASEACADWAEKKTSYDGKKALLPTQLAAIQNVLQAAFPKKSQGELKNLALASEKYVNLVIEMTQAHLELSKAEGLYKGLMKSLEALTAISYVVNNEIKLSR